jgi:hypothetical protein
VSKIPSLPSSNSDAFVPDVIVGSMSYQVGERQRYIPPSSGATPRDSGAADDFFTDAD